MLITLHNRRKLDRSTTKVWIMLTAEAMLVSIYEHFAFLSTLGSRAVWNENIYVPDHCFMHRNSAALQMYVAQPPLTLRPLIGL